MSERKVLNKYYPPDFDPSKIPKLRLPRNRQYSIRIMSPFNMRCNTCGEYIYKGKKFNSRKETVEDEEYLGLKIFRFYIKCPRCVAEIAFKTDPQNTDYSLEGGATRNFEAMRTAEMLARQEIEAKEAEEANNPMKVLENRTKQSQQEMEMIETLEELRELNTRHAKVDHDSIVKLHQAYEEQLSKLQDEEDEKLIQTIFGKSANSESVKRLQDDEEAPDLLSAPPTKKMVTTQKPTDLLTEDCSSSFSTTTSSRDKTNTNTTVSSWGRAPTKSSLAGLVKRKTPGGATSSTPRGATGSTTGSTQGSTTAAASASVAVSGSASVDGTQDVSNAACGQGITNGAQQSGVVSAAAATTVVAPVASGLGLLGAYSDSDSNSDDSS